MDTSTIDNLLQTIKPYYIYYIRVQVEMTTVMRYYKFYPLIRCHPDGQQYATLNGTLPIMYRGNRFSLPICIMFPFDYPLQPAFFFTDPTPEMEVVPNHPYALPNFHIQHPILARWEQSSNILAILHTFVNEFSHFPPLRMKENRNVPNAPHFNGATFNQRPNIPRPGGDIHYPTHTNTPMNQTYNTFYPQQLTNRNQSTGTTLPPIKTIFSQQENSQPHTNQTTQLTPLRSREPSKVSPPNFNTHSFLFFSNKTVKRTLPTVSEMFNVNQNGQELPPLKPRTSP
ncbi:Tumor susceptibility gene 101 protein [Entamoeba marina]